VDFEVCSLQLTMACLMTSSSQSGVTEDLSVTVTLGQLLSPHVTEASGSSLPSHWDPHTCCTTVLPLLQVPPSWSGRGIPCKCTRRCGGGETDGGHTTKALHSPFLELPAIHRSLQHPIFTKCIPPHHHLSEDTNTSSQHTQIQPQDCWQLRVSQRAQD
jgi:hypothetical protein